MSSERIQPGKSAIALGPSGSGKSHLIASALEMEGSGVLCLAQGNDELESYRRFYKDADFLITSEDAARLVKVDEKGKNPRLVSEKPFLIATFDDPDFFPSLDLWKATGLTSALSFLRLIVAATKERAAQGLAPQWNVLGLDTFSGIGDLANNSMCSELKVSVPPKARGDGGAQYYIGYKNKLNEVARACRAIRGYGTHWLASSHVQLKEAPETFSGQDVVAKEQQMAMFTGAFREMVPGFFDLVLYTGIDSQGKHYAQYQPDKFRSSKSRYKMEENALDAKGRIENDWPTINKAIK